MNVGKAVAVGAIVGVEGGAVCVMVGIVTSVDEGRLQAAIKRERQR
ncbi:hypothetical protein MASR2M66_08600 [Chloroflexota bacterium]